MEPVGIQTTQQQPISDTVQDHGHTFYVVKESQSSMPNTGSCILKGARCSSVVRTFAHGAMGRRIDPSWVGPIELFLVPASAPRLM